MEVFAGFIIGITFLVGLFVALCAGYKLGQKDKEPERKGDDGHD